MHTLLNILLCKYITECDIEIKVIVIYCCTSSKHFCKIALFHTEL